MINTTVKGHIFSVYVGGSVVMAAMLGCAFDTVILRVFACVHEFRGFFLARCFAHPPQHACIHAHTHAHKDVLIRVRICACMCNISV